MSDVFRCGHPRTPENSTPVGNGAMRCRICKYNLVRVQYRRKMDVRGPIVRKHRTTTNKGKRYKIVLPENYPCGHPRTPENNIPNGEYTPKCRICHKQRLKEYHARNKSKSNEASLKRYAERRAAGLCTRCDQPSIKTLCPACYEQYKIRRKKAKS